MSTISVTVLTPNGRRQNVRVVLHMTLLQILEEVCKKHDFKSEEYCLKHHNRELDLTQMFQFSGLPNKCFLEMFECSKKRRESEVIICIQLEDGTRRQGEFLPHQTLKDVLLQLSPESLEQKPVIVYMRVEMYGKDLEEKTLKNLGVTKGRAMLRVLNKNPKDLKNQANVYIPSANHFSSSTMPETESKHEKMSKSSEQKAFLGINADKIQSVIFKSEEGYKTEQEISEPVKMEIKELKKIEYDWTSTSGVGRSVIEDAVLSTDDLNGGEEMTEEPDIFELGERNAVVFSLDSAQKTVDDIPDSFFDLTVDDIKILLRDLRKEASGNENVPLLTSKLREMEESSRTLTKLNQYKKSVIRIQFPDRMVLQGTFSPIDKIENVYDFVRNFLKDPALNFFLFTTPPKKILERNVTLVETNCVPTAVLHFGVDERNSGGQKRENGFLKDKLKQTSATGAILAASKSRGLNQNINQKNELEPSVPTRHTPLASTGAIPKQPKSDSFKNSSRQSSSTNSSQKIPKWFKSFQK